MVERILRISVESYSETYCRYGKKYHHKTQPSLFFPFTFRQVIENMALVGNGLVWVGNNGCKVQIEFFKVKTTDLVALRYFYCSRSMVQNHALSVQDFSMINLLTLFHEQRTENKQSYSIMANSAYPVGNEVPVS
jgi:hypothetical protein